MKTKLKISLIYALVIVIVLIVGCLKEERKPILKMDFSLKNPITSSVKVMEGIPRLLVGNKTIPISGIFIYQDLYVKPKQVTKQIDYAAENGFSFVIVSMWWYAMDTEKKLDEFPEDAAGRINWKKLDEVFDYAASKGVYVIPAFRYCCSPPAWWYTTEDYRNKYYAQTNEKGKTTWMPSFNVEFHEKYADQVITYMVNRYKTHPALLGWELGFGWTVENNYPSGYGAKGWYDYSPFCKAQFRNWLKKAYKEDISKLRDAWGNNTVTFENAEIPQLLSHCRDLNNRGVNSAGDKRRQFYDWQLFRLKEKKKSRNHFAKLFKQLDSNHVLFANSGGGPLSSGALGESAYTLNLDYYDYASSPYIDGVFACPGFRDDQKINSIYETAIRDLINYMHRRGKATFIAWENWGVNKSETLQYIIKITADTGTGMVLATGDIKGPGGELEYAYSDKQIKEIAGNLYLLKNAPKVKKKKFAFIDFSFLSAIDYQKMGYYEREYYLSQYKSKDAYCTAILFRDTGLDYDVLSIEEIIKEPGILNDYLAVGIVDLFRMNDELKDVLVNYRNRGGGLFIVGRSAVFDKYGNYNSTYLQQLLNVSSPITEYNLKSSVFDADSSWNFVSEDKSGLIEEIESKQGDGRSCYNLFNIPVFDYAKEDYKVIGHLTSNNKIATVGYKGRTVFWFPRMGMQIYDRSDTELEITLKFLENLYAFYENRK
ncbi:beta-galactosidase [bacterium]|nr:beta-galactosidase [bacterium]